MKKIGPKIFLSKIKLYKENFLSDNFLSKNVVFVKHLIRKICYKKKLGRENGKKNWVKKIFDIKKVAQKNFW